MLVEAKAAFYNEETGAVQPWRDIEVTDTLGNELVSEGLAKAIEGGGGGGGDLSTAEVTIINNDSEAAAFIYLAYTDTFESGGTTYEYTSAKVEVNPSTTKTISAVLYKGECDAECATGVVFEVSAGTETSGSMIYITGDCTITISSAGT